MPERQPRESNTFPSPFPLALLLVAIAVGTLIVGLLSFSALGNFLASPSVIKQAQAVESPTSGTIEATTEIPTSDLVATLEPSATLFATETATIEPSPTRIETETPAAEPTAVGTTEPTLPPTETVVVETPTVSAKPTQTEIPQDIPTNTLEHPRLLL